MLDIILLALLLVGFFIGLKRGFILQFIHLIGSLVALIVAYTYADALAPHLKELKWIPAPQFGEGATGAILTIFDAETLFYRIIAFVLLFLGTKIALRLLGRILNVVSRVPILRTVNRWFGGMLGFIEVYVVAFIVLSILAVVPNDTFQQAFNGSFLAQIIVYRTPLLSALLGQA